MMDPTHLALAWPLAAAISIGMIFATVSGVVAVITLTHRVEKHIEEIVGRALHDHVADERAWQATLSAQVAEIRAYTLRKEG